MYILFLLLVIAECRFIENKNLKIFETEPEPLRRTKRFNSRYFSNQLGMDQWATHDPYRIIRSDMFQNKRKNFDKTIKVRVPTEDVLASKLKQQLNLMGRKRFLKNKRNIAGIKIAVPRRSRIWDRPKSWTRQKSEIVHYNQHWSCNEYHGTTWNSLSISLYCHMIKYALRLYYQLFLCIFMLTNCTFSADTYLPIA